MASERESDGSPPSERRGSFEAELNAQWRELGDDVRVLALAGSVEMDEGDELYACFREALGPPGQRVVVDLSQLEFIGSIGLATLVKVCSDLRTAGGWFCVASPTPRIDRVLRVSQIERIFDVHPDLEAALKAVRGR